RDQNPFAGKRKSHTPPLAKTAPPHNEQNLLTVCSRRQKTLEIRPPKWEIPTMTVVTDNKKRVILRLAKPGDRFDVQVVSDGNYMLTKLEPVPMRGPAKVRIEKRGQHHVGVLD